MRHHINAKLICLNGYSEKIDVIKSGLLKSFRERNDKKVRFFHLLFWRNQIISNEKLHLPDLSAVALKRAFPEMQELWTASILWLRWRNAKRHSCLLSSRLSPNFEQLSKYVIIYTHTRKIRNEEVGWVGIGETHKKYVRPRKALIPWLMLLS